MEFSIQEMWESTGTPVRVVLFLMATMAIWCMYVAVDRLIALNRARKQSRALAEAIGTPLKAGDAAGALKLCQDESYKSSYLAHMLAAGFAEFVARHDKHGIESTERALDRVQVNEGADLRKGMNILATTGATAPFVGLVGTIFGIINAFQGMAEAGSGCLASVSAGIAEALITTAIGISVAILGVWLFNFFTARIEAITNDMAVSTQEIIDWCEKQLLPPMDKAAK